MFGGGDLHGKEREAQRDLMSARTRDSLEDELLVLRAAVAAREEPLTSDKEAMDAAWIAYYGSHNVPDKHEGKLYAWQNAWHAALAHARSATREDTDIPSEKPGSRLSNWERLQGVRDTEQEHKR